MDVHVSNLGCNMFNKRKTGKRWSWATLDLDSYDEDNNATYLPVDCVDLGLETTYDATN